MVTPRWGSENGGAVFGIAFRTSRTPCHAGVVPDVDPHDRIIVDGRVGGVRIEDFVLT